VPQAFAKGQPQSREEEDELIADMERSEQLKHKPVAKPKTEAPKSQSIGSVWIQKDGSMNGNLNGEKINLTAEAIEKFNEIEQGDHYNCTMNNVKITVFRNKFKEFGDKKPDFVIYPRGE
jgi:hypothetical protein